ncbi:MAG: CheR family methyltransferase [Oligoflexia bacterium]
MRASARQSPNSQSVPLLDQFLTDEAGIDALCRHLYSLTGIFLPPSSKNRHLVVSRLSSLLRKHRWSSLRSYLKELEGRPVHDPLNSEFISALTTNTTQFFREPAHYEFLARALPGYLEEKCAQLSSDSNELRIWCAAASTGQEPLSILMLVQHELQKQAALRRAWRLKFLASDIDEAVLEKASRGVFLEHETQGLSPELRERYFIPAIGGEISPGAIRAHPELLSKLSFARINLTESPYPFSHPFDVVFLRNVLIYFDTATVSKVIDEMGKIIRPGGLLFLGHSESGCMRNSKFKSISHAVYRRVREGER